MDLVDEQQRAGAELVAALGRLGDRLADILDPGIDRRQRGQLGLEGLAEQPRERGLAAPGRPPQDQRRDGAARARGLTGCVPGRPGGPGRPARSSVRGRIRSASGWPTCRLRRSGRTGPSALDTPIAERCAGVTRRCVGASLWPRPPRPGDATPGTLAGGATTRARRPAIFQPVTRCDSADPRLRGTAPATSSGHAGRDRLSVPHPDREVRSGRRPRLGRDRAGHVDRVRVRAERG